MPPIGDAARLALAAQQSRLARGGSRISRIEPAAEYCLADAGRIGHVGGGLELATDRRDQPPEAIAALNRATGGAVSQHRRKPGAGAAALRHGGVSARSRRRHDRRAPPTTISPASSRRRSSCRPRRLRRRVHRPAPANAGARHQLFRTDRRHHFRLRRCVYELDEPVGMIETAGERARARISRASRACFSRTTCATRSRATACPTWCRSNASTAARATARSSCRDADKVAVRFLKALQLAGGTPQTRPAAAAPTTYRPSRRGLRGLHLSQSRRYHPGHRLQGQRRRADYTVYSRMRFPLCGRAGLRQFPVVHELRQLRQHRPIIGGMLGKVQPIVAGSAARL